MKTNKLFFALVAMLFCFTFFSISASPNLSKIDFAKLQSNAALLNGDSNPLQYYINYTWNDEQWQAESKESYKYDNLGRVIEVYTSIRENNEWIESQKGVYEYYGETDNLKKVSVMAAPMGTYIQFAVMDLKYDQNWKILEQTLTVLIPNPFLSDTKIEYKWNNDLMTEIITYDKDGSEWVNNSKSAYNYDNMNELPAEEIQYVWEGGQWVESFKNVHEYGANDSLSLITGYTWDSGEWVNSNKTAFEYNGLLKTKESTFIWSTDWEKETQIDYSYNTFDKLESDISQRWTIDTWFNIGKNEYFYEAPNSVDEDANNSLEISIYPNPSSDFIMVSGSERNPVSIMTIEGSVVIKEAKAGSIDISSLAPGMYYVVSGNKTGRFIKY